jgi:predicted dehydrogenase
MAAKKSAPKPAIPSKKLRVGLIGAGAIAEQKHLPYWRELEAEGRVEIAAICDVIPERAASEAAKCAGADAYTDHKKMLRDQRFDIIDVCTQNRLHAPLTIDGLNAGANVLVEKPMAMNARECEQMIAAAKKNKRKLMVAQHMRFESAHMKLKEVVQSGQLGEIYTANTWWLRRRGIPGWGKFHIKKESLGGPLIDIGVHMMDLTIWLMGSPKPVSASGKVYRMFGDRPGLYNAEWGVPYDVREFDVEDFCTAMIRFEKGITLQLSVSWAANIDEEKDGLYILGDKAGIATNPAGIYSADGSSLTSTKFDYLDPNEGHQAEIRHFTECVERNLPVMVQPEESLRIQRIIDAIYESSAKNREVAIKA